MTSLNPHLYTQTDEGLVGFYKSASAVGAESKTISKAYEDFVHEYFIPISRESIPWIRFHRLKKQWEAETEFLSSVSDIAMNPAYQQIIGMGSVAIPFILRAMSQKQGQWFWALKSITNEDPVKPKHRGVVMEMTKAWIQWGKERGYID